MNRDIVGILPRLDPESNEKAKAEILEAPEFKKIVEAVDQSVKKHLDSSDSEKFSEFSRLFKKMELGFSDQEICCSYEAWIRYQDLYNSKTEEERSEYDYVIWNSFSTPESWIEKEARDKKEKEATANIQRSFMKLPWYERILIDSPIKDLLIKAFINDPEGEAIREELCVWDIPYESLFGSIKHFSKSIGMNQDGIDDIVKKFMDENRSSIEGWCFGVCGDGGRVLRTISIACGLFNVKYGG